MPRKQIHLICNAHLDPVWLWPWEDGLTETLSTFRVAAEFAEKHRAFVFNHNESLLYAWVEKYEPELLVRIQRLVRKGQWHISGGAYLQPDVNNSGGLVDIRDISLVIDAFQGVFQSTTLYAADLWGFIDQEPCRPQTVIDIVDITTAVDTFSGFPFPCAAPCP